MRKLLARAAMVVALVGSSLGVVATPAHAVYATGVYVNVFCGTSPRSSQGLWFKSRSTIIPEQGWAKLHGVGPDYNKYGIGIHGAPTVVDVTTSCIYGESFRWYAALDVFRSPTHSFIMDCRQVVNGGRCPAYTV